MSVRAAGRLPDFVIAGVQKGGTTSLHHHLKAIPGLYFNPGAKELHYFDDDAIYGRGHDWYRKHFADAPEDAFVGQTSPRYFYLPQAVDRMAALLPNAKIIVILRDPVTRAYSHYWHVVKRLQEWLTFDTAVQMEPARILESEFSYIHHSYMNRGRYATQLAYLLTYYPRDRVLILLSEEFAVRPRAVLLRAARFIGLDITALPDTVEAERQLHRTPHPRSISLQLWLAANKAWLGDVARLGSRLNRLQQGKYPPIATEAAARIREALWDEVHRLEAGFGVDVSAWTHFRSASTAQAIAA